MAPHLEGNALFSSVTTISCLAFLLIGFDNGLMGGFIESDEFVHTFGLVKGTNYYTYILPLIVAIYEIGCFVGALITSFIGESLGRKRSIFIGACIMIVGAILQASSYSVAQIIVGRIVSGIGMGFMNSTVPVLQAEYSPKAQRGLYVCMQLSTLNFGIMMVYWVDFAFQQSASPGSYVWRVPTILQCIFLVPILFLVTLIPETPRWLAGHDRNEECLDVLRRLHRHHSSDEDIQRLHQDILDKVALETAVGSGSWKDLLQNDEIQSQRRFLIACSIQAFQQLGGINAIIYYSATLFSEVGFDSYKSGLMSGYLNTWFFVASFIPWFLIDRVGRRPLLLSMIALMAAVMAVQSGLIYQVQHQTGIAEVSGRAAAAMLFIFEGAFTVGFQATVWVYPAEILPLKLRQRGSSVSTSVNWLCNFLIVYITPPAITNIGWRTYIIFAVLNATWVPIIYFFYPETARMELEDIDRLFMEANGYVSETVAREIGEKKGAADRVEVA